MNKAMKLKFIWFSKGDRKRVPSLEGNFSIVNYT